MKIRNILLVLAQMMSLSAFAHDDIIGVATIIDGDTIKIRGERIRLHGIDSPETGQRCEIDGQPWRCGKDASFALADKVGRGAIRCEVLDIDRYKRSVGRCFLGATDLNRWMVSEGWAVAYRKYSDDYVEQERKAKAEKVGIWKSHFEMPWEWRRAQRRTR